MSVTVQMDEQAIRRLVSRPDSPVVIATGRRVRRVETRAKRLAPVDTGRLRASIHTRGPSLGVSGATWDVVAPVAYAHWVHEGWRTDPRVRRRIVFARAGARPFLREALHALL